MFYIKYAVLCWFHYKIFDRVVVRKNETCGIMTCGMST